MGGRIPSLIPSNNKTISTLTQWKKRHKGDYWVEVTYNFSHFE